MQIFPTSRHFARFFFRRAAATAPTASRCMSQREAPSSGPEVFFCIARCSNGWRIYEISGECVKKLTIKKGEYHGVDDKIDDVLWHLWDVQ